MSGFGSNVLQYFIVQKGILFSFSYKFAHVTLCIRLLHSIIKYVNQPLCHDLYGHTLRQLKRKDITYPRNNTNISSSSLITCILDRGIQVCSFTLIMHMTHNSKNGFASRDINHCPKHAGEELSEGLSPFFILNAVKSLKYCHNK